MSKGNRKHKRRGWWRFFVYVCVLLLVIVLGGFLSFAYRVDNPEYPDVIPNADGIVVWTGKGGGRLNAGANLLQAGHGERLLISGVNESNDRDDVLELLNIDPELAACCIDLDYAARDTIGNARETVIWAEVLGYEHIILVTSAYHMPRAEMEISQARGKVHVTTFPVASDESTGWWNDPEKFRFLSQEYGKLLLTYMRRIGSGTGRGTPVLKDMPEPSSQPQASDTEPT